MAEKLVVVCEGIINMKRKINHCHMERSTAAMATSSNGHASSKFRAKESSLGKDEGAIGNSSDDDENVKCCERCGNLGIGRLQAENRRPTLPMQVEQLSQVEHLQEQQQQPPLQQL